MSTKIELEKQVKDLKEMIRELRDQVKIHVPNPDDLPVSTFCMVKQDKDWWLFDLKMNPETDEIMVVKKEKQNTRDLSIIQYRAQKCLICDLRGKKRENM